MDADALAGVENGGQVEPEPVRKRAVPMTQKFALPRPAKSKIDEAAGRSSARACLKMSSVSIC